MTHRKVLLNILVVGLTTVGLWNQPLIVNAAVSTHNPEARKGKVDAVKNEILATNMSFDAETGEIKYTLPEPALVRIRIGIRDGGPLLTHLLDWEYRDAGTHTEVWDKKDATGQVDFGTREDYLLVIACIPVEQERLENYQTSIRGFRKAPKVIVTFPESSQEDGVVVINPKQITTIRITLDEKDRAWLTETKYEMGIFIDRIFLMEDEKGINPFTYEFNPRGLREGEHMITVNVIGYDGEIGTTSLPMRVKK